MMMVRPPILTAALPPPPPSAVPLPRWGRRRAQVPLARWAEGMERRAAHGPGARNRMRPAFALRALCEFSAPSLAPPRSVHASGLKLRSLPPGPGAPTNLRTPARLTRFDLFQTSRPATGEASRNTPDPGVYTRQSRSTGPRRRFSAWVPRRLSCGGDGERLARPRGEVRKSGRETVGVLIGWGNFGGGCDGWRHRVSGPSPLGGEGGPRERLG